MALRTIIGCLPVAALVLCLGCKDKAKAPPSSPLDTRCAQLAKACADTDKHVGKLVEECMQAAQTQVDKGCTDKATAAYDCYQKELCGKADKVWALDDFRVLGDREKKC